MATIAAPAGRFQSLDAFRSRDFRLLWGGQTISLVGDAAFLVALGWKTFSLTGSTRSLAIVLMAHGLAMLGTLLIGGVLADRYPRRMLMIISDLARFGVIGTLAVTDASGALTFPLLIALAVGFGLGDGFFYPAFGAIVPLVVDQQHIASANTLVGISRQLSFVVGPALAGVIYGLSGSAAVFGLDAATFLFAAGLLWLARPRSFEPEERQGTIRELVAGFRYVMSVPWLWISIFVASFILMIAMAPYQALLPQFVREEFDRGVGSYGLLFTFQAAGMVAGSLLFGQLNPRSRRVIAMCVAFALNDLVDPHDGARTREQAGACHEPRFLRILRPGTARLRPDGRALGLCLGIDDPGGGLLDRLGPLGSTASVAAIPNRGVIAT